MCIAVMSASCLSGSPKIVNFFCVTGCPECESKESKTLDMSREAISSILYVQCFQSGRSFQQAQVVSITISAVFASPVQYSNSAFCRSIQPQLALR